MAENNEQSKTNSPIVFPTVGACYSHGWQQMGRYFPESVLIIVLAFVLSVPSWALSVAEQVLWDADTLSSSGLAALLGYLYLLSTGYTIFIQLPLEFGIAFAFLKAVRNDRFRIGAMFEAFRSNYMQVALAGLLYSFIVVIGVVFFIIPGIIFACKLAFVPYLVVDRHMNAIDAIKESWRMTTGHALTVFFIGFLSIFIAIGGFILLIVGIIPAIIWIEFAFASLYHSVSSSEQEVGLETAMQA